MEKWEIRLWLPIKHKVPLFNRFMIGTTLMPGVSDLNQIPNPDLSWEYSESFDAGIDFGFFNGRLSGYVDYYHTSTGTSLILNRRFASNIRICVYHCRILVVQKRKVSK